MIFIYSGVSLFKQLQTKSIMRTILITIFVLFFLPAAMAEQSLTLGNSDWPPFIIKGQTQGASERLVCEALNRAGWNCSVKVYDWDQVLKDANEGVVDGIAAVWRTPKREEYLLFSEPYLTNRIVPVIAKDSQIFVQKVSDLSGWRVAMAHDYAYGDEIAKARSSMTIVPVASSAEAFQAIQEDKADIALVDDLVARAQMESDAGAALTMINAVLAHRELYVAVSRKHPRAEQIISDFHHHYEIMLKDGVVNDILDVDWLATDIGNDGQLDLVLRSGVSFDDLGAPEQEGTTYALGQSQYQSMLQKNLGDKQVNYFVEGRPHSSLQETLIDVFGEDTVCKKVDYSSEFDCTGIFQKE